MRHLLLILCLALPVLAQPLPLAWQDRPQGTVLCVLTPYRYDGATATAGADELILAWSDMRDGYGRVMLQKVSTLDPAAPGAWESEVEGLGHVEALAGSVSATSPFSPVLASDEEGGAFVLWQEIITEGMGELRLQHAGDGPGGEGAFHWPADLVLAPEVPIPFEGCRDAGERCRAEADGNRAVCIDGAGGAWVLWRNPQDALLLQHVTAQGGLDPDFPIGGLVLPVSASNLQLCADAAGNALLFFASSVGNATPLSVLGVRADGTWLLPEISRLLSPASATVHSFSCADARADRLLVAWGDAITSGTIQVRAQLLDMSLDALWPTEGVLVGVASENSIRVSVPSASLTPFYVAFPSGTGWLAQALDEEGTALWEPAASLDAFADEFYEYVQTMTADIVGLAYTLYHNGGLCLQRLTSAGVQLWPTSLLPLSGPDHGGQTWRLATDGQGNALVAWTDYQEGGQRVRLSRRGLDGLDLHGEEASVILRHQYYYGGEAHLLRGAGDPLFSWERGDSLFAQSVRAHDGTRLWGFEERLIGPHQAQPRSTEGSSVEVDDGAWLISYSYLPPSYAAGLFVQKVDLQGVPVTPRQLALPGNFELPNFWGQEQGRIVAGGGLIYVACEVWAGPSPTIRLQCLTPEGELLWGEQGIEVCSQPCDGRDLLGLWAAPGGGVDVGWKERYGASPSLYLQHFSPEGEAAFEGEDGRGLRSTLDVMPWQFRDAMAALPDGGWVLAAVNTNFHLGLQAFDAMGEIRWTRQIADMTVDAVKLEFDPQGGLWLSWTSYSQSTHGLTLQRLGADGQPEQSWTLPLNTDDGIGPWSLVHGEDATALVVAGGRTNGRAGQQLRGFLIEDGQPEPALRFDAPLLEPSVYLYNLDLAPAPQGDLWLLWKDTRGAYNGYGEQSRLTRLDVLDLNTSVENGGAAAPSAFVLEPNRPNPFNPETWISFALAQPGPARLEVFNLAGQRVRVLQDGPLPAGHHRLRFDARDSAGSELGSGLYFYRLSAGGQSQSERMLLVR